MLIKFKKKEYKFKITWEKLRYKPRQKIKLSKITIKPIVSKCYGND